MNDALASRNLVVVRAGKDSLHPKWLPRDGAERRFDVLVSCYQDDCLERYGGTPGVSAVYCPGGKWDGLYRTLCDMGAELDRYDFVWLPDDDIETTAEDIAGLFEAMRETGLKVGQPSLTPDSYFTHFLFIHCPGIAVRWTNYVEIMVPCLHRSVLKEILPDFRATMSGYGFDYVWCRLPGVGRREAGIIDGLQVRHTRPIGSSLSRKLSDHGTSSEEEQARIDSVFGVTGRVTPLAYGLRTQTGREIDGLLRTACCMAVSHFRQILRTPAHRRRYGIYRIYQLLRRQATRKLDLSTLTRTRQGQPATADRKVR